VARRRWSNASLGLGPRMSGALRLSEPSRALRRWQVPSAVWRSAGRPAPWGLTAAAAAPAARSPAAPTFLGSATPASCPCA